MRSGTYVRTPEIRRKNSIWQIGDKNSAKRPEVREKMRQAALKRRHPEKTKRKIRESHLGKPHPHKGGNEREKHWNWQGGKSFEPYSVDWTEDIREAIRKRDNYVCQICGIHQTELKGLFRKLDIHHIDYDKDNLNPKNLISLCKSCHMKTNYNREYWQNYFKKSYVDRLCAFIL